VVDIYTLEAFLSLLFFITILLFITPNFQQADTSLYQFQIAQDAWRVLYLRGDFESLSDSQIAVQRAKIEGDMVTMGSYSGFCFFIDGINYTNCRSGEKHIITASMQKTLIYDGELKRCTFSIAPN
jgi:hypothetical protein